MSEREYHHFGHGWHHHSPLAIAGMVAGGFALAVVFAFLFGWIVLYLWNWLMPVIFGLPVIGYWQAWGLVILSHILLKPGFGHGGFHGRRHREHDRDWRGEMKEKFESAGEVKE
jgi:hypothetical protein